MREENGGVLHEDRRRSATFGEDAARYDRARPSYPADLVDVLMAFDPKRVLDVGCGTGIAARLLAERGCHVLGVEQDARMAEVASGAHGLEVDVARFEDWDARGRTFDLVISGQAWHWVDPRVGFAKAADVLAPGGHLGVFWNFGTHETAMKKALDEVYEHVAPELVKSYALGTLPPEADELAAFKNSGRYDPVDVVEFNWERRYAKDEWLDQLPTHSDHRLLPAPRRDALLVAIGGAIDELGGSVLITYRTKLVIGSRIAV